MILFTLAAVISYAALAAWTHFAGTGWEPARPEMVWAFVFALPVAVTYTVAQAVNLWRARWSFDRRSRRRLLAFLSGLPAGVIGAAGMSLVLATTESIPAAVALVACPAIGALVCTLPMRRLRVGWCVGCGYDLRAATVKTGVVCPECGMTP